MCVWLSCCTLRAHAAACEGTNKISGPCGSADITAAECDQSYGVQSGQGWKCGMQDGNCLSVELCDPPSQTGVLPSAVCTSSDLCEVKPSGAVNTNCADYNNHDPSKLLDGNDGTIWHGHDGSGAKPNRGRRNGKTPIIEFTFPEKVSVNYIKWSQQNDANVVPTAVDVLAPDGNNGWITVAKFTNQIGRVKKLLDFSGVACVQTTKLRLKFLSTVNSYSSMGRINDIWFYTKKAGTEACKENGFAAATNQVTTVTER